MTERFKLSEAKVGQHVVIIEPMNTEIRWTHLERREGTAKKPTDVPCFRTRLVQGSPGRKPRYDDSGCFRYPAELPGIYMVVDGAQINHDWTEAHDGLMIVSSGGWTGFYLNSRLIHKISPHEWPTHSGEPALIAKLIEAMDKPIGHATAIWNGLLLPDDLTQLKLSMDDDR